MSQDTYTYSIDLMQQEDVPDVSRVERLCFSNPWPSSAYRRELRNQANNYYIVLREHTDVDESAVRERERAEVGRGLNALLPFLRRHDEPASSSIVGFAGMWILFDEAHVTTIGVLPDRRGRGLGELMLADLFAEAERRNAEWMTLEVRVSNDSAQQLYTKYGFRTQGVRRRYYSDNNEDAYIMWSESMRNPAYLQQLQELREQIHARLGAAWRPAAWPASATTAPVPAPTDTGEPPDAPPSSSDPHSNATRDHS